tara:strand:+ start:148 stop:387 length:240 start_codon:yes stop_codon:yes gene_type:complete
MIIKFETFSGRKKSATYNHDTTLWESGDADTDTMLNAMHRAYENDPAYLIGESDPTGLMGITQYFKDKLSGFISINWLD